MQHLRTFLKTFALIGLIFWGLGPINSSMAFQKTVPTMDQSFAVDTLSNPNLSPDGRYVLYSQTKLDFKANKRMVQGWIYDSITGANFQLTQGKESSNGFVWSRSSDEIAFLRKGALLLISINGGEARTMNTQHKGISNLRFSPDGKYIYYLAQETFEDVDKDRKDYLGDYEVFREEGNHTHLYRIKTRPESSLTSAPEQLTSGFDFSINQFEMSPNGEDIAFTAGISPRISDILTWAVYRIKLEDKKVEKIFSEPGISSSPVWSPDSKKIAFSHSKGFPFKSTLKSVSRSGGSLKIHSEAFDESVNPEKWTEGGIYFSASQKTERYLFLLDPDNNNIERQPNPENITPSSFSLTDNGNIMAFIGDSATALSEIYLQNRGSAQKLTNSSDQIKNFRIATRELITWKAEDGTDIEGILIKPHNYSPSRKYPLFVVTHGGPTAVDRPTLSRFGRFYPLDTWAGNGALILQTNYRGSSGYGEAFQSLNKRNLGVGPATDIIAGINYLSRLGMIDPNRVGCLGWSQGGHISAMLATYSNICTASHMGAGISNWKTYYYNTDITPFTVEYFDKTPSEDDEIYNYTSPITYIRQAQTPVLIQHGENDARVPIANAYELRQALRDNNVENSFIIYKGMGHGPRRPDTLRGVITHLDEWFNHYLFQGEKPNFVEPYLPAREGSDGN